MFQGYVGKFLESYHQMFFSTNRLPPPASKLPSYSNNAGFFKAIGVEAPDAPKEITKKGLGCH